MSIRKRVSVSEYIELSSEKDAATGCWLWKLRGCVGGYGRAMHDRKRMLAHRMSWETFRSPIPEGIDVCHRCDTPLCVNPDHLFLGTHAENMRDMVEKGRTNAARGERCGAATLTESEVKYILECPLPVSWVAQKFGVTKTTASRVRLRKTWTHIDARVPARYMDGRTARHLSPAQVESMASCWVEAP